MKIYKELIILSLVVFMALTSCSKWTDTESITYKYDKLEDVAPALYERYLENLREYRDSEHKIFIAKFDNKETLPGSRAEHISCLPDSVDYVILSNPTQINEQIAKEMVSIRQVKGIKTLFSINFREIEKEYEAMLEAEQEAADQAEQDAADQVEKESEEAEKAKEEARNVTSEAESGDDGSGEGEPGDGEGEPEEIDPLVRKSEWIAEKVAEQLSLVEAKGFDGVNIIYRGKNPLSMNDDVKAEVLQVQEAFFRNILSFMNESSQKDVFFEGLPGNLLITPEFLQQVKYIIISTYSAVNESELTYILMQQLGENIPVDKFVIGVSTINTEDDTDKDGVFSMDQMGNFRTAIVGGAEWVVRPNDNFKKLGLCVNHAQRDYYNVSHVYKQINKAISIMNPSK